MTIPGVTGFADLDTVLAQLVQGARLVLGADFVAAFLHGSFALDDADEGSDVDFVVVVRSDLTDVQERAVQALHRHVWSLDSPWAQRLEGSYFPQALLRRADPAATTVPYLDNGSRDLQHSAHDNTLVMRWIAREHGISLDGPGPHDLIDAVPADALQTEVRTTLNAWGNELLSDPAALDDGWRQPYVALSIARMLHTLDTGQVHSKRAAVAWGQEHVPVWAAVLERAWAQHPGQFGRVGQPAPPGDLDVTRQFIQFALEWARGDSPASVAARQLQLYNARDLEPFVALWAPDARLYAHPDTLLA
ncbi:aminoglycoside adenylyltransferase domain-containing protein [Deinococcus sp.]|uniref:aminoglycoside adenylyltransferase domain-containing protein n=1 Tax=Deinococcus sp. TaxID=47478 RepID=UPI002869E8FE|nr:aminoglycoside adenylyltransferase domain-containing protein [Deinococcus sp.]